MKFGNLKWGCPNQVVKITAPYCTWNKWNKFVCLQTGRGGGGGGEVS
jgi:hypothetical protein